MKNVLIILAVLMIGQVSAHATVDVAALNKKGSSTVSVNNNVIDVPWATGKSEQGFGRIKRVLHFDARTDSRLLLNYCFNQSMPC